jgi:hypothetical protein
MRNETINILSASDASSQNGVQIDTNQILAASFQAVFGDSTAGGTVQVQMSNDIYNSAYLQTFTVSNWTNIPSASATVTAGASVVISVPQMCYRWIRVIYTSTTPGTSTINVNMNALSQ